MYVQPGETVEFKNGTIGKILKVRGSKIAVTLKGLEGKYVGHLNQVARNITREQFRPDEKAVYEQAFGRRDYTPYRPGTGIINKRRKR